MIVLVIAFVLAVVTAFTPLAAIEPAARLLTPAVALLSTSIFPCLTLAVGAMKGEQRTPKLVEDLYSRLHVLMQVLLAAFALAAGAILALVLAVMATHTLSGLPVIWVAKGLASVAAFLLVMLVGRAIAIGRAFFAILEINKKHALLISRGKSKSDFENIRAEATLEPAPTYTVSKRPLQRVQ